MLKIAFVFAPALAEEISTPSWNIFACVYETSGGNHHKFTLSNPTYNFDMVASPDNGWTPKLSELSRCLAEFRQLERDIGTNCPLQERTIMLSGQFWSVSQRTTKHWEWLRTRLKDPETVHPRVRPRHARMLAEFFATMPTEDQEDCLGAVEAALQYLPEDPAKYFQLENAGFQLKLQDGLLQQSIVLLAKKRFDDKRLEESKTLLRTALSVGWKSWLKNEAVDRLTQDAHFFSAIGSPYHAPPRRWP